MDKKLRLYELYLQTTLADFSAKKSVPADDIDRLISLHRDKIREFQHERLIHLLVTFFFGGLLLFFCSVSIVFSQLPAHQGYTLTALSSFIALILLVVELFYIRHYYQLENGVQRLEAQTEKIHTLR